MRVHKQSLPLVLFAVALAVGVYWCLINRPAAVHRATRIEQARDRKISRVSYPDSKSSRHHVFGDLEAVVDIFPVNLTGPGKAEELLAGAVTANFFQSIGVEPIMGRAFSTRDAWHGRDHVVILSHRLWSRHFGSSTEVVGRNIKLGDEPYRVIGILPPDFTWNNRETDVWVPAASGSDRDIQPAI
jgi:hypothetical protein